MAEQKDYNPDSPCIIQTAGLTKAFGVRLAVEHLDLQVMRGDIFGFLGPNGSGKTTTIRMLLGLVRPTAGSIQLFGQEQSQHLSQLLPRIGAIIETPVFYPYLSGLDNLRVVALRSGIPAGSRCDARLDEILTLIDLSARAKDAYRKYSLGMKQRLALGAALLTDPELILLDEPTNGLDPAGVHEMRELICRLPQMGKTVFLSSHLLYEIQLVCNRVAILNEGHLLYQSTVQELLQREAQIVVRMNTHTESEQTWEYLQHLSQQEASWLHDIKREQDAQGNEVFAVNASSARSSEITALLAQEHLYVAEIYQRRENLEDLFLQLTNMQGPSSSTANVRAPEDARLGLHP